MAVREALKIVGSPPALAAIAASLLAMFGPPARADIIHVYEGESIQAAIDSASNGDEIIVHPGTYNENIDFIGKAIFLHSSEGPSVTTICSPGWGRVVVFMHYEGEDSVITGFTITGGSEVHGAGMYIKTASPTVTGCWFMGNAATHYARGMDVAFDGSPTVSDCHFIGNTATLDGGGIRVLESTAILSNCEFTGNSAEEYGGGIYASSDSTVTITDCRVGENQADLGGGMFCDPASSATVADSFFCENAPDHVWGGMDEWWRERV